MEGGLIKEKMSVIFVRVDVGASKNFFEYDIFHLMFCEGDDTVVRASIENT